MNLVWYVWLPFLTLIVVLLSVEFVVRKRYQRMRRLIDAARHHLIHVKRPRTDRPPVTETPPREATAEWVAQRNE